MYGGIIAPGFECHISQARYSNTPPLASFSIFSTDFFFCHYQDKCFVFDSVAFRLSVFAICFTENNVWLLILIINKKISNASYSEWCGQFFLFCFCFLVYGGLLLSLLPLCIAILYFKIEVGLCNQTNVSNNKRRMVPLGPCPPRKLIKHVCKFVCP